MKEYQYKYKNKKEAVCPKCGRTHYISPQMYHCICICKAHLAVLRDGKNVSLIKDK